MRFLVLSRGILFLTYGFRFCREVFCFCREVFCFCREVFGFDVTVVGYRTKGFFLTENEVFRNFSFDGEFSIYLQLAALKSKKEKSGTLVLSLVLDVPYTFGWPSDAGKQTF